MNEQTNTLEFSDEFSDLLKLLPKEFDARTLVIMEQRETVLREFFDPEDGFKLGEDETIVKSTYMLMCCAICTEMLMVPILLPTKPFDILPKEFLGTKLKVTVCNYEPFEYKIDDKHIRLKQRAQKRKDSKRDKR